MSEQTINDVKWNSILEKYFAETGEKCQSFSWLHKRSEEYYNRRTVPIDIIVIILGTLNGATSVGSKSIFGDTPYSSIGIGIIALICSILNTVNSYFSWGKRTEGHRIASLQYGKLYRFLSVEMSLPREERLQPKDLLKYTRDQYDRLQEISPLIPQPIITLYKNRFNSIKNIAMPEETNGLHKIDIYKDYSILSPSQPIEKKDSDSGFVVDANIVIN
jgi:hypothetical protein